MAAARIAIRRAIAIRRSIAVCVFNDHCARANVASGERIPAALVDRCFDVNRWVAFEEPNRLEDDAEMLGWHSIIEVSVLLV